MPDPIILSLDLESYGKVEHGRRGNPLPPQTVFHPRKSKVIDGVDDYDLIATVAITLPVGDPRCPCDPDAPVATPSSSTTSGAGGVMEWTVKEVGNLEPGQTMVFEFQNPTHRKMLRKWLARADTIIGMNLLFDLSYLRHFPDIRPLLTDRIYLIDLSILNFMHSEVRPERKLKDLGPVLGLYRYADDVTLERSGGELVTYPNPSSPELHHYNAEDTHNTLLACTELARRITRDYADHPAKLTPYALRFYSDLIWDVIAMTEAGTPLHVGQLLALEERLSTTSARNTATLKDKHDITLKGKGSALSRYEVIENIFAHIDAECGPSILADLGCESILAHPLTSLTEKKLQVSFGEQNRRLASHFVNGHANFNEVLKLWDEATKADKLISTYTWPLLRRKKNPKKNDQALDCVALPQSTSGGAVSEEVWRGWTDDDHPLLAFRSRRRKGLDPNVHLAFPRIYITPSPFKDDSSEGGQRQGRLAFQGPAVQTFPPSIKACEQSRYGKDGRIVSFDLSQIELRTAAILSGDEGMLAVYADDGDLHTDMAIRLFGGAVTDNPAFGSGDHTTDPRQWSKQVNFLIQYRGGPLRLQETILKECGTILPNPECYRIVRSAPDARPGLWAWQEEMVALANKHQRIVLPITGHSRTFLGGASCNPLTEIVNFPVQDFAASVMLRIQYFIRRAINALTRPLAHIYCNRYDAIYFDCRTSNIPALTAIIKEAITHVEQRELWHWLCQHTGHFVPLRYSLSVGGDGDG